METPDRLATIRGNRRSRGERFGSLFFYLDVELLRRFHALTEKYELASARILRRLVADWVAEQEQHIQEHGLPHHLRKRTAIKED